MAFERPIVFVRTLPAGVDTKAQYFLADIYSVLNSSVITAVGVVTGGAGYLIGDTLEPNDGTGTQAEFTVTSVSGGSITGVEITDGKGGLYSVVPTTSPNSVSTLTGVGTGAALNLTVTKNWTVAGGTQTTDTGLASVAVANPGTGGTYAIGNTLTIALGSGTQEYPATIRVTSVSGGQITGVALGDRGSYSANPTDLGTNAATGGGGSGALFSLTMASNSQSSGSFSFKAGPNATPPSLAEPFEVVFNNSGTPAVPHQEEVKVGLNPDGASFAVADTTNPTGTPNFSTGSTGTPAFQCGLVTSLQYLLFDFGDCLVVLFKDGSNSKTPQGFMTGLIFQPRWLDDIDGDGGRNSIRIDGLGTIGSVPEATTNPTPTSWFSNQTGGDKAIRLALGTGLSTGQFAGWTRQAGAFVPYTSFSHTLKGPTVRTQSVGIQLTNQLVLGEMKYLKTITPQEPLVKYQLNGEDYLMHFDQNTGGGPMTLHIPDGLNPNVDGVYVP